MAPGQPSARSAAHQPARGELPRVELSDALDFPMLAEAEANQQIQPTEQPELAAPSPPGKSKLAAPSTAAADLDKAVASATIPVAQLVDEDMPQMADAPSKADDTAQALMAHSTSHDFESLHGLYAQDATFSGPIFGEQDADGNLGKLVTEHDGTGAIIQFDPEYITEHLPDGTTKIAISWVADYKLFWAKIHNEVVTHIIIDQDGKILSQVDVYDKARWLEQLFSFVPGFAREWIRSMFLTPYMESSLGDKGREAKAGF